jgi:lipopolysaccharide export system permease protein
MALAKPALIIASTVVIFNYFLSLYLLPVSYREFKDTQIFVRDNYAAVMLQEGVFSNPVQGMTVYIDARQPDGLLKGILVHDTRTPQRPMTLMAQEGRMIQTEFGPRFDMINGNRQEIGENGNLSVLYFDRYAMDISVYAESTTNRVKDEKERFLHELLFPEESLGESMRSKLIVEGHHRLAWPLFCFAVTLIAISALLSGQFNRRGQFRRIVFASVIAASVLVLDLALKNVASSSRLLIPLLYLNPILVSSICLYILLTARINALPFQNILERIKVLSSGKLYWGKG